LNETEFAKVSPTNIIATMYPMAAGNLLINLNLSLKKGCIETAAKNGMRKRENLSL